MLATNLPKWCLGFHTSENGGSAIVATPSLTSTSKRGTALIEGMTAVDHIGDPSFKTASHTQPSLHSNCRFESLLSTIHHSLAGLEK